MKAGDVLAELDKEQLQAVLRGAEANLQAARAALAGAEAALKKNIVEAEGPDVEFARRNYERAQQLFAQKSDLAVAARRRAQRHRRRGEPQARGAVPADRSARRTSRRRRRRWRRRRPPPIRRPKSLAYATIRAPIRATVLSRDVEIGSPVSSILNLGANATLVMTLGDIEKVFVRGKVDEADIGRVRLDQPARIRVETFKDRAFNGRVTQISPLGVEKDNVTSFEVKVSIDNPGRELKANMTANAEIVLEEHPNALLIPEAAVTYDAKKNASVDVVAPGDEDRPQDGRQSRSVSATARKSKCSTASSRATSSCCQASRGMYVYERSLPSVPPEPAREQAAQLSHDVRHPLGHGVGRRFVGDGRGLSESATDRSCGSSARTSASSGAAAPACRRAANARAA